MTQRSKLTLFNAALTRTGNDPTSDGEGSAAWQALEANYPDIVRSAFEGERFPFGMTRVVLTSRAAGRFGYDDAFSFSSDIWHVHEVFLDGVRAADLCEAWELDTNTNELMINAGQKKVEIEGVKAGLEYTWTGRFATGIQRKLEAVIRDVLEEVEEANAKDAEGDFQLMRAGVKASNNRSQRKFRRGGRLTEAHGIRGGR